MKQSLDIQELQRLRCFAALLILEFSLEYGCVLERVETMLEKANKADPTARALRVLEELESVQRAVDSPPLKVAN